MDNVVIFLAISIRQGSFVYFRFGQFGSYAFEGLNTKKCCFERESLERIPKFMFTFLNFPWKRIVCEGDDSHMALGSFFNVKDQSVQEFG